MSLRFEPKATNGISQGSFAQNIELNLIITF